MTVSLVGARDVLLNCLHITIIDPTSQALCRLLDFLLMRVAF